jgi:hypothetical protein
MKYPYFQVNKPKPAGNTLLQQQQQQLAQLQNSTGRMSNMDIISLDSHGVASRFSVNPNNYQKKINNEMNEINSLMNSTKFSSQLTYPSEKQFILDNGSEKSKNTVNLNLLNGMLNNFGVNQTITTTTVNNSSEQQKNKLNQSFSSSLADSKISEKPTEMIVRNFSFLDKKDTSIDGQLEKELNDGQEVESKEKVNDVYINVKKPFEDDSEKLAETLLNKTKRSSLMHYGPSEADENEYLNQNGGFFLHKQNQLVANSNNNNGQSSQITENWLNDTKIYNAFSKQKPTNALFGYEANKNNLDDLFTTTTTVTTTTTTRIPALGIATKTKAIGNGPARWEQKNSFEDDELASILG